jgi:hypothetical protein
MTSKNMTRNDFLRISAGFVGMTAVPFGLGCPSDDTTDDGADSGNVSTTDTPPGTSTTDDPGTTTGDPQTSTGPIDGSSSSSEGSTGPIDGSSSSGGGDSTTGEPGACVADPDVEIGSNHGHELVVPLADVMAGVEATYDIQGTSMHPHSVTLTAEHFTMLQGGMQVMVDSSNDNGHTHAVTVSCA